jgi:hypothetical protein
LISSFYSLFRRAFDEYKDRDYLDSIIGSRSRRNESEKESSRRSPDGREKEELDVSF